MARVLVTGGAGFIGSNLARRLAAEGDEVIVVDNLLTGRRENLASNGSGISFVEGDIRDAGLLREVLEGVTCVFHQAAVPSVPRSIADPWTSHDHNANGTLNLLIAGRDAGVKRFVYAASSSAYGEAKVLPRNEDLRPTPLSPYAVAKYVGEMYCNVFYNLYGIETVALRYFNVFGPNQDPDSPYSAVIPKFIRCLLAGEAPVIHGDGEQTRDFTYVDNVVEANILASQADAAMVAGKMFNIGCGERTSLNQLLLVLQEVTGAHVAPIYLESRAGDVRDSVADTSRARDAMGYAPSVSLRAGLERTVEWMESSQRITLQKT